MIPLGDIGIVFHGVILTLQSSFTDSCYDLIPAVDEQCVSYQATMTGDIIHVQGDNSSTLDTIGLIAQQMNSGAVTGTVQTIRVKFLGVELDYGDSDTGRDVLPPAKSVVAASAAVPENNFTLIGIAIVTGLTMALLGAVFAIARRRRNRPKSFTHQEFQDEVKSEGDTKSVTKLDISDVERDIDGEILHDDDNLPESPEEFSREYNFDLGGWMKSELIGIHGGTAITAQQSGADEMLSDSDNDNDSWAQTEATIGSLELRLDPIEAEV